MSSIAFIGVGTMGAPMAGHLATAGHQVRCYSRTPSTRERTRDFGGIPAGSVVDAVRGAQTVITMLPDTPDVQDVALGDGKLLDALAQETDPVWVDMSTIDPGATATLWQEAADRGIAMLDAPVSGGEAAAREGTLSVMVGGDPAVLDAVRGVLDLMAGSVVHVGPAGSGQVAKAANQMIVAGNIQLLAEALAFLRAHGADAEKALDAIAGGLAGSTVLNRKRRSLTERDYTPGFRVELHHKDLGIVEQAARAQGLSLPATALVTQLMAALRARGDARLDHSALSKLVEDLNGGVA